MFPGAAASSVSYSDSSHSVSSSVSSTVSSSYPTIAPFTAASNIEYVDPCVVHGWHSDVWKLHVFAVSKNQVEFDSEKKVMKHKVFCTLCTAKIWEKFNNGTTNLSSHLKCTHANNARVKEMLKSAELLASERWEERAASNNALIQACTILFLLLHRCF